MQNQARSTSDFRSPKHIAATRIALGVFHPIANAGVSFIAPNAAAVVGAP
ncbi:MAG: hypothetical protein IPL62_08525 [Caulobacteraceae bacterium]|jgi:hypothetical protein|nr:hypothetical protein [Caulobacteraceae bacterium]